MVEKRAFSLAESIMSMIIVSIIALCIIPILGRQRPGAGLNATVLRGAYACYYNGSSLTQVLYDGRRQDTSYPAATSTECTFKENKRAARFYYIATGAGSQNVAGQVVTGFTPEIKGDLTIKVGKTGDNFDEGSTTIKLGSNPPIIAYPGFDIKDKDNNIINLNLMPDNIKACKIVSNGCPTTIDVNSTTIDVNCQEKSRQASSCNVVQFEDKHAIQLGGCDCTDDAGNQVPANIITFDKLERTSPNSYKYKSNNDNIKINLDFYDSSYGSTTKSHMAEILTNMNGLRQNDLIDEIIKLEPGKSGNKGAVVILW